jgi:uncharacterized protein (UPF0333 family)
MSKAFLGCAGVIGLCVVLVIGVGIYLFGINNSYANQEAAIKALHNKSKLAVSTLVNELPTQGLAVEKYQEILLKAIEAAKKGTYGPDGSKAVILALHEQNPNIDSEVIAKLQRVITARYSGVEAAQSATQDAIRIYQGDLDSKPRGWIGRSLWGFPKINVADYDVVIAGEAKEAFETHKLERVDPFKK